MADDDELEDWRDEWARTIGATLTPHTPSFRGRLAADVEPVPFSTVAPERFEHRDLAGPNLGYPHLKGRG